jgi:hypothetical protein
LQMHHREAKLLEVVWHRVGVLIEVGVCIIDAAQPALQQPWTPSSLQAC